MSKMPKLRFKEFSGEWEEKKLGNICTFFSGGTPTSSNKNYYDGNIPFIGSGKISADTVDQYITEEALKNSSAKLVKKGDLLYALYGATSGEVAISKLDGAINQAVLCIRSQEEIYFLLQWLLLNKTNILSTYLQGGQGNLSAQIIKSLDLYLPLKEEQQKIASFLSVVDTKIDQLSRKKELFEQYKKGVMQKIFSQELRFKADDGSEFPEWEEKKLKTITKIYDGTHTTPDYVENGIPFYSVEHLTSNNFKNTKFISEEVFEKENKRVKLEKYDILMTRIGDIGTSRLLDWDVKASFYVSLALIKNSNLLHSSFLNQQIKSSYFQRQLHNKTLHVAFPKKINLGEIGDCTVMVPVLNEQTKIASFLSAIDTKSDLVAKQLDEAKNFKKGLLQQMFV